MVLASGGYPESYETGFPIDGVAAAESAGAVVFHAGTEVADPSSSVDSEGEPTPGVVTSGGRVLAVTATAPTLESAAGQAYAGADLISFDAMVRREDIGRNGTDPAEDNR